jgi:hypothetical protein
MAKDKKRESGKKDQVVPHFRRERITGRGHPVYIYDKEKKKYFFVGTTHSEFTSGMRNIELENDPNPNPKERKKSYIRPKPDEAEVRKFGGRLEGWRFRGEKDKKSVDEVIKRGMQSSLKGQSSVKPSQKGKKKKK